MKILLPSKACAKEVINHYSHAMKKSPHILMSRCIRDPYVQRCEMFSLRWLHLREVYSDYALVLF
jgi:hypothetical protein